MSEYIHVALHMHLASWRQTPDLAAWPPSASTTRQRRLSEWMVEFKATSGPTDVVIMAESFINKEWVLCLCKNVAALLLIIVNKRTLWWRSPVEGHGTNLAFVESHFQGQRSLKWTKLHPFLKTRQHSAAGIFLLGHQILDDLVIGGWI